MVLAACGDDVAPQGQTTSTLAPSSNEEPGVGPDPGELPYTTRSSAWIDGGAFVYELTHGGEFWSGRTLLVDEQTGAETPVSNPPFRHPLDFGVQIAPTGGEVFVIGDECEAPSHDEDGTCPPETTVAAMWSALDDTWRSVDVPEALAAEHVDVAVVGVTGDGRVAVQGHGPTSGGLWTYSPVDDEWMPLPDPGPGAGGATCVARDDVVTVSARETPEALAGPRLHVLAGTDPSGEWEVGPPAPGVEAGLGFDIACGADEVVVFSTTLGGATADEPSRVLAAGQVLGGEWVVFDDLPQEVVPLTATAHWTGSRFVLGTPRRGGAVLDLDDGTWRPVDSPDALPGLPPHWTEEAVVGGGDPP